MMQVFGHSPSAIDTLPGTITHSLTSRSAATRSLYEAERAISISYTSHPFIPRRSIHPRHRDIIQP